MKSARSPGASPSRRAGHCAGFRRVRGRHADGVAQRQAREPHQVVHAAIHAQRAAGQPFRPGQHDAAVRRSARPPARPDGSARAPRRRASRRRSPAPSVRRVLARSATFRKAGVEVNAVHDEIRPSGGPRQAGPRCNSDAGAAAPCAPLPRCVESVAPAGDRIGDLRRGRPACARSPRPRLRR